MAIADIKKWLSTGRPYAEGVKIFEFYGTSPVLKKLFAGGDTYYNRTKLAEELNKLNAVPDPPKVATSLKSEVPTKKHIKPNIPALPPALQALNVKKGDLFRLASRLHTELFYLKDKSARAENAKTIKECFTEIDAIWEQLDNFATGVKPVEKKPADPKQITDPVEIHKRIINLRTYISKYSNNTKRKTDVEAWKAELKNLQK